MARLTPRNFGDVVGLGEATLSGLIKYGELLSVRANTLAIMTSVWEDAHRTNDAYRTAISDRLERTAEQNVWFGKAGTFITLVRDNLKPTLGTRYNQSWGAVGLFNGTLAVPRTMKQRLFLLSAIQSFFTKRPELEIPNVATAALAQALHTNLLDAYTAATRANSAQRQKKTVRDAAVSLLRQRLQGLRAELKLLLAPNDPRWLAFGFKVPTDVHVTEAPQEVKLALDAGHLKVSWGHVVNAERYRVYERAAGTAAEFVPMDTTTETWFDLGIYMPGTEVEVQVTAINAAGESRASETAVLADGGMKRGTSNAERPTSNIQ